MIDKGLTLLPLGFDAAALTRSVRAAGWRVYEFPVGIHDKSSFFRAARTVLPLDPPIVGEESWDALSDSLWEGLHATADERIAILWLETGSFSESEPADFLIAKEVLVDVAATLASAEYTLGRPKLLAIFLADPDGAS